MIRGEYDGALQALHEASQLRPGQIVLKAIADTRKAQELAASMQQIEERASLDLQRREAAEDARRGRTERHATQPDVVELVDKGLPAAIIMRKIGTSANDFDTSADVLVALSEAGVDEDIIMAIIDAE